jgi:HAD superfamily phosphoserine phosphatase-like hydrolase
MGTPKHFLIASDFDKTLSFNDSGQILSDLLGVSDFQAKVDGLAASNLVQQGGELAYLIRHDPAFRGVRRAHLIDAGRRVRLRPDIPALLDLLKRGIDGCQFSFFVVSAAPQEVIQSALAGILDPDHIVGTEFDYDEGSGEVQAIRRVPAGYGKVAALEAIEERLGTPPDRTIYVGDGSSDVHVMLHVNNRDGFTIAVSENRMLARIARSTIISDTSFSILIPVLERVLGWGPSEIRDVFESYALTLHDWEKARTDRVTIVGSPVIPAEGLA